MLTSTFYCVAHDAGPDIVLFKFKNAPEDNREYDGLRPGNA